MGDNKDNPPAFPNHNWPGNIMNSGMTIRDYFAAAALQGLLASDVYIKELDDASKALNMTGEEEQVIQPKVVGKTAYRIADAMLKARNAL